CRDRDNSLKHNTFFAGAACRDPTFVPKSEFCNNLDVVLPRHRRFATQRVFCILSVGSVAALPSPTVSCYLSGKPMSDDIVLRTFYVCILRLPLGFFD
ncbi:MAG: hypothetical protein K2K84_02115, partial [Muribaculaceae bacterium]|nr:hypothetical protein [Muribaculaceae bacterium]